MQLNVQKIETLIQKINFLFKSIKKSDEVSQHLEVALLKQYAINLYDAILESEQNLPTLSSMPKAGGLGDDLSQTSMLAVEKLKLAEEKRELKAVEFEKEVVQKPIKLKKVEPAVVEKPVEKVVAPIVEPEPEPVVEDLNPTDDLANVAENITDEVEGIKIVGDVEEELRSEVEAEVEENWIEEMKNDDEETYDSSQTEVLTKFSSMGDGVEEQVVEEFGEKPKLELNDILAQQNEEPNLADKLSQEISGNSFNISVNQRFAFVQQLFAGDAEAYETTLFELEKCSNVIEAFTYINLNVKMTYKWDDESPITREFQEVVKAKFLES